MVKTFISVTLMTVGLIFAAHLARGGPRVGGGGSRFSSEGPRFVSGGTHSLSFEARSSSAIRPPTLVGRESRITSRASRLNVSSETFNHLGDRLPARSFDRQNFDGRNHPLVREAASWHVDWDRNRDHFWLGHRCRFANGSWIIFDEGLFPDDYYPDNYSSDNYDAASVYPSSSSDSRDSDPIVLEVQVALQKAGYDPGSTDGVLGPLTREAISRYQKNHGLEVTGSITEPVIQALGLD